MSKWFRIPLAALVVSSLLYLPAVAWGQVLLMEDFEDGMAESFQPQDGNWRVEDGQYICEADGYGYYSRTVAGDESWANYTFECDLMVEGSFNQMVFLRYQDADNFYEVNVRGEPWNDVFLFKWTHGIQNYLYSQTHHNSIAMWHHYRISATSNWLTVEFDGQQLFSYQDDADPILNGGIALVGFTGGEILWQTARFDNVAVVVEHAVGTENSSWGNLKALFK